MLPRRALELLYDGAAWAAALFMVGTLVMVLIGIIERFLGFHLPGTDAYAGYCMAAAGFLALAQTFRRGEHIRVTLVLERAGARWRPALEVAALAIAALLAASLAFYSTRLAYQSWDFHDMSTANDATPLWIPQLAMAIGTVVLLVAVTDALCARLRGQAPATAAPVEALHHE